MPNLYHHLARLGDLCSVRRRWLGSNLWRLLYKKDWYAFSQGWQNGGPHGTRPGRWHLAQSSGGSDLFWGLALPQTKHLPSTPKEKLHS